MIVWKSLAVLENDFALQNLTADDEARAHEMQETKPILHDIALKQPLQLDHKTFL